jgi:DNA repair protein SbcD/Mre11
LPNTIRILFLADTHLGFDYTFNPRIERRRRGDDFFRNYELTLQSALEGKVDCVVHGGDLLYRSKVPPKLVWMAFQPLLKIADQGIPVYLVPGNHERSVIPYELLGAHPLIHIFREPQTYFWEKGGVSIAFSGFPCDRDLVRENFTNLLSRTQWQEVKADYRFLCLHQAVEGAQVGVQNYTFRYTPDVIKDSDLPPGFTAVLTGHIHRAQVLKQDLAHKPLPCPVIYPGSIERTDFAEMNEKKGYFILEIDVRKKTLTHQFIELPARPMFKIEIPSTIKDDSEMESFLKAAITDLPSDAVIKFHVPYDMIFEHFPCLHAHSMREIVPLTMNFEVLPRRLYA